MEKNLTNSYREIGFPDTVISSAEEIASLVRSYYEMEFDNIFISNVFRDDHIEYPSLWLFNDHDAVECKNFLTRLDFDIVRYKRRVRYINVITDSKDSLFNPTQNSRMVLETILLDGARCQFEAVGENCHFLSSIAKRYLREYKEVKYE